MRAVGAEHGAGSVDDAVGGLAFGVRDECGRRNDPVRHAEECDHGFDRVDAHVHEGTGRHLGVEDVRVATSLHVVIARGVLAEAEGRAAKGAELLEGVEDLGPGGIVDGAHRFERDDVMELRRGIKGLRLETVGAGRLLDEDVLIAADAGEGLVKVERVGARDVDGIDVLAISELLECGERASTTVTLGELAGCDGVARVGAHVLDAIDLRRCVEEVVADH